MRAPSNPSRITDSLYCLGPAPVPSFLLDGEMPALFEAGIYAFGPSYANEARVILDGRRPAYLFLTHMHFDHCGSAGYLKREFPGLAVCGSEEGARIVEKPSAIALITRLNDFGQPGEVKFEPFTVDRVLSDGEEIRVSADRTVRVIKTPGHTRDMLSYYIPEIKALIPSETVGVPGRGDYIFSEFLIDFDTYLRSIERLRGLDVEILILAHGSYYTGEDARAYIPRAIAHTQRFRERIEFLVGEHGGDTAAIAAVIKGEEYDPLTGDKQPERAYMINLDAKIKAVVRRMNDLTAVDAPFNKRI
ncbi:MAG: MBL fold metallo-hydrolase [Spirochaetes bacterium]|nr:MAG: MBL fold metallo-hydrolase [Spirochaetota bacterium]